MKLVSTISPGLAEEYGLRTYSKGDCVLFQNEYYRCIADEAESVEPVFPMDETKWEKVDFSVEVTGLKTGLAAEATVRENVDKANATAIADEATAREKGDKENSDAISALTTAVADEVKTRKEEDDKRPTKDEAILVGENKNKDFSLDGDYSASQGYLTDVAVNASVANIKYFFIPPEPLTSCGIVQVKVYGGLEIAYTDPVLFVLWSYSGSGAFSDDTCKYLGYSDNTVTLAELTAATCTFTSNPYGLQITAGQGLIVQGVPADVTPDNTWKWSEKADLYTVLTLACHSEPDSSVFEDWVIATDEGEANRVRFGGMLGVFLKNSVVFSAKNGGIDVANGTGMTVEDVDKTYKTNAKGIGTIILDSAKSYADTQDTTVLSDAKSYTDEANAKAILKGDNYADGTTVPSFYLRSTALGVVGDGTYVSMSPTTYFRGSVRGLDKDLTVAKVDTVYKIDAVESTGQSEEGGIGTIILKEAKAYADTVSQKVLRYMGSVATVDELPKDAKQGDMYNVTESGANYAWTGTEWDKLSETVDLSGLVTKTTTVNGKEIQSGLTLYGTDIKATYGSTATIQEAALDDAISAIKKYGEETYAFGDGTTPDEFPACTYFSLSSSKITDSTISSISVTAPKAVSYSSPIRLVLWAWEKVGQVENTFKFLGYSSDSHSQLLGEVATWSFDGISLPKGAGLVVQGVPDDVTIDDSWTWDENGFIYTVLAVKGEDVEDEACCVRNEGAYHGGCLVHCSITAVPRSGQTVGSLAADVASLTTTVANKANTADVIVRGTNYENPSISLYSSKKGMMGGVSSSFSVQGVSVMTTSGPGTSTIEDVDSAYRAGTISDIRGIGSLIKESTLADIETAATHTYTFGANGAAGDKFAKSLYAILSPLLLPYGTIKSVAMMASDNVSVTGAKYMLLWAHDGSGSYSSSTCTFLGKSVEAVEQTASTLSTWRFEDVTLPQDHGLIIHLVPEDAAPSGDAWDWGADSGRFEVASCKCQHGVYGNIINSNWNFFSNFIPHCEVTVATKPTAGKILTGNNVSESSLVGQTDAFAPVTRSGANTLKVDVAGLSPYGTEAGHYGVVAVCSTASGYQKMNLGQSALAANSKELVILKPNQNGTHPGVVSPSATAIPDDTVECPTVISGDKATIKAYAPKETDPKFTAWKEDTNIVAGLDVSMPDDITASVAIGDSAIIYDASEGAMALGCQAESRGNYSSAIGCNAFVEAENAIGFAQDPSAIYLNSKTSRLGKEARTLQSYLDERAIKTDVVWTGTASGMNSGYMKTEDGVDPMIVSGGTGCIFFSNDRTLDESSLIPDGSKIVTKNVLDSQGYATKSDLKMTVTNSTVTTSASEYIVDMTQEDTIVLTAAVDNTPEFKIKLPLPDPNTFSAASYTFSGIKRLIVSASKPCKIAGFVDADYDGTTDEKRLALLFEKDADGNVKDIRNETFESGYVLIEMFPVGAQWSAAGHTWGIRWSRHGLAF